MSIPVSIDRLQGKERKEIIKMVQQQAKQAALEAIRPLFVEFLEAEVEQKLGRKKGVNRHVSSQQRAIDWTCGSCGCQDANQFTRDGHYKRNLETGWGHIQDLRVPMLECQNCHHDVLCTFRILEKYQRFWLDLDQDVLFSSGVGQSLRIISERWSEQIEGNVGLRTINERINRIEPLIQQMQKTVFPTSPTVVQLDGIWVTVQGQGEKVKPDKRKRQRKQRTGKKIVILVALGFWENGTREILDWQIAASEEHTQWEGLLNRLWAREVRPEKGLRMIVRDGCGGLEEAVALVYGKSVLDQRCIFHKLKNVGDKVRSELKGEEKREKRKEMMKQAKTIYQAPTVLQAKQRLQEWSEQWREEAPKAVATLERDFEHTLIYYELDTVTQEWIRTTSLLERTNRELRRKFRQVVTFGSQSGAQVAVYLQVQRLHARWTHASWWQVSHDLIFELGNIHP